MFVVSGGLGRTRRLADPGRAVAWLSRRFRFARVRHEPLRAPTLHAPPWRRGPPASTSPRQQRPRQRGPQPLSPTGVAVAASRSLRELPLVR
eukprot:26844-Pyramimonas_sp.AAC.1